MSLFARTMDFDQEGGLLLVGVSSNHVLQIDLAAACADPAYLPEVRPWLVFSAFLYTCPRCARALFSWPTCISAQGAPAACFLGLPLYLPEVRPCLVFV